MVIQNDNNVKMERTDWPYLLHVFIYMRTNEENETLFYGTKKENNTTLNND